MGLAHVGVIEMLFPSHGWALPDLGSSSPVVLRPSDIPSAATGVYSDVQDSLGTRSAGQQLHIIPEETHDRSCLKVAVVDGTLHFHWQDAKRCSHVRSLVYF